MISPAAIEKASSYRLGKDFSEGQFADYLETAIAMFQVDDPGLPPVLARKAVTYYVLHQIALESGELESTTEKLGNDYHVVKGQLGESQWLVQYRDLVRPRPPARRVQPSSGAVRSDASMSEVVRRR